jgi:hypothetical protein
MTEAKWLKSMAPQPLCVYLRGKATDRKLRLFAVACCRQNWHPFPDERCREAVDIAERFAEGTAGPAELRAARLYVRTSRDAYHQYHLDNPAAFLTWAAACDVEDIVDEAASWCAEKACHYAFVPPLFAPDLDRVRRLSLQETSDLLRDIFGNPFRPVSFLPSWRTDTAVALARQMYESRDFGAMPILADALQDAMCDNEDILSHCRDVKQSHVRGCWVVDLVLGKE